MSAGRLSALGRVSSALRSGPPSVRLASSHATSAKVSSSSSSSSSSPSSSTPSTVPPSPFHPWKNPETSRWRPPHFSLRRQAQLANLALREGFLHELPSAPKFDKLRQRIETTLSLEDAGASPSSGAAAAAGPVSWPPAKRSGGEQKAALELAKRLAASRGPYVGRSERRVFKGTKAQRTAPAKRAATAAKLEGMQKAIDDWRKGLRDAKDKSRSSVPF